MRDIVRRPSYPRRTLADFPDRVRICRYIFWKFRKVPLKMSSERKLIIDKNSERRFNRKTFGSFSRRFNTIEIKQQCKVYTKQKTAKQRDNAKDVKLHHKYQYVRKISHDCWLNLCKFYQDVNNLKCVYLEIIKMIFSDSLQDRCSMISR